MGFDQKVTSKCNICKEVFQDFDTVILVDSLPYHDNCVTLYPTGYIAFHNDQLIGETDNDDGQMAIDVFV